MRAIVVGPLATYSVADVAHGWVDGLRDVGVDTAYFDLSLQLGYFLAAEVRGEKMTATQARQAVTHNLLAECYLLNPDVVFIVTGNDVDWELASRIACPVVLVLTECPYELEGQAQACAGIEPSLVLVNDPVGAEVYSQFAPTFYLPHAYRPNVHTPGSWRRDLDCLFVGTGFPNRIEWLTSADWSGVDLHLAGMWKGLGDHHPLRRCLLDVGVDGCTDNASETVPLYQRAVTTFNVYRTDSYGEHSHADGWAISPREVESVMTGVYLVRDPRGEGDEVLSMFPTFASADEMVDQIRWALAHPDERAAAVEAGQAALADRTFANHAARALARLF